MFKSPVTVRFGSQAVCDIFSGGAVSVSAGVTGVVAGKHFWNAALIIIMVRPARGGQAEVDEALVKCLEVW
jgi:hypothetical protein